MNKKLTVLIIDVTLLLICFLNIKPLLDRPVSPIEVYEANNFLIVDKVIHPDAIGKIQPGDTLLSWNDFKPRTPESVEFLADLSELGELVSLEFSRRDSIIRLNIPLDRFYPSPRYVLITIIIGFIIWSLGLFMFFKGPGTMEANTLKWIMTAFAVSIMTTTGSLDRSSVITYILESILYISYICTVCGFYFFSCIFPVKKNQKIRSRLILIYFLAGILVAVLIYFRLVSIYNLSLESSYIFQTLFDIFHLAVLFFIGSSLGNFISALKVARGQEQRLQVKWLLWGVAIGSLPFLIFSIVPQIIGIPYLVGEEFTVFFFLAIPLSFSIAIIRFRILDIDFLINRSIVYGVLTLLIGSIYVGAIFMTLSAIGGEKAFTEYIYIMLVTMLITLLFNPLRIKIQNIIDLYIFTAKFNARKTISEITSRLSQALSRDQAVEIFINIWIRSMPNMKIAYLSYDPKTHELATKFGNISFEKIFLSLEEAKEFCKKQIFARSGFVPPNHPNISSLKEQFLSAYDLAVAVPVRAEKDSLYGLIIIKSQFHTGKFIDAEIDLLASISELLRQQIAHITTQENLFLEHAENARLKELNELKSFFVSSITHELKTPLSSIKLHADLLRNRKNKPAEVFNQHLDIIEGESDRLNRLIDNVLNISKIERNAMRLRFSKIDLNEEIRETLKIMKYQLDQKSFELHTDIFDQKTYIWGDSDAIRQVLTNLIANAIQYSLKEKFLSISCISNDRMASIKISDRGIGISDKDQNNIFKAFFRGTDDRIANIGGAGIGLAVVSHIISEHGGKITLTSKLGAGTTITISFPLLSDRKNEKNSHY